MSAPHILLKQVEDRQNVRMRLDADMELPDLVAAIGGFLRACGYEFRGNLQIVEEDDD